MSDITIKVKVKYTDGDWVASTPVYDITGVGHTPEEAIGDFQTGIENLYSGGKFLATNNRPIEVSYMITGVSADVYLNVKMDRPLSEFGVGVQHDATEIPALPGPSKQYPSKQYPIADYTNGIPEALALMAMLTVDCGGPIVLAEAEAQCSKYTDAAGIPLTLDSVQQKYPDFVEKFEESTNKINGDVEFAWVVEFRPSTYAGTDIYDGNSFWKAMKKAIDPTPEDVVDEEEGTPSSDELSEEGTCCRNDDPLELAYGISLDRYMIERISDERQRYIVLPSTSDITSGVRVLVYEKGEMKGRKAYVGEFVAGERFRIERGDSEATEWMCKLHIDYKQFAALFGTQLSRVVLEIVDYKDYADPIAIPDGMKAPRGVNWIPPMHLGKLFPGSPEKGKCPFRVDAA